MCFDGFRWGEGRRFGETSSPPLLEGATALSLLSWLLVGFGLNGGRVNVP